MDTDAIELVAAGLETTAAAVRAGLKEFVSYWTIGEGMGRRHTKAKWASKAREDVRKKHGRGELPEPEEAPDHDAAKAAIAAREAALEAEDREHRERLKKRVGGDVGAANVKSLVGGIGQ